MNKLSAQSKSFLILITIAAAGVYVCLMLWSTLQSNTKKLGKTNPNEPAGIHLTQEQNLPKVMASEIFNIPAVDTSGWATYSNPDLGLSFLYKPGWRVLPVVSKSGFQILQIDPGRKFYNIKIYISPTGYYAMSDLPAKADSIGGQPAQNVNYSLYGVKVGSNYYTFDIGLSMSLLADFNGLVHTVKFN